MSPPLILIPILALISQLAFAVDPPSLKCAKDLQASSQKTPRGEWKALKAYALKVIGLFLAVDSMGDYYSDSEDKVRIEKMSRELNLPLVTIPQSGLTLKSTTELMKRLRQEAAAKP